MTETEDIRVIDEAVIDEAVRQIDAGLSALLHRELVSTDEVSNLLLDVRMLLTAHEVDTDASALVEEAPVGA